MAWRIASNGFFGLFFRGGKEPWIFTSIGPVDMARSAKSPQIRLPGRSTGYGGIDASR